MVILPYLFIPFKSKGRRRQKYFQAKRKEKTKVNMVWFLLEGLAS
jgi:hypothetical protein